MNSPLEINNPLLLSDKELLTKLLDSTRPPLCPKTLRLSLILLRELATRCFERDQHDLYQYLSRIETAINRFNEPGHNGINRLQPALDGCLNILFPLTERASAFEMLPDWNNTEQQQAAIQLQNLMALDQ